MPLKDFLIWLNVQLDSDKIRPEPGSCFVSFFNQALDPGWRGDFSQTSASQTIQTSPSNLSR